jgi:antitoxin ParD1/3/4
MSMDDWPKFTPEEDLRIQRRTRERGMTFEVFLPEGLSDWLKAKLEAGVFESPAEAAFVAFQDMHELDRHPKVLKQLLKAMIQSAMDDPRPDILAEEAFDRIERRMIEDAKP